MKSRHEILVFHDQSDWLWRFVDQRLGRLRYPHVRMASGSSLRRNWSRFQEAPRILICWESKARGGGAIVEELLDLDPAFDVADRVIVLSTNPTHEDVMYFSELGIRRIITLRNVDKELKKASQELQFHLLTGKEPVGHRDGSWLRFLGKLERSKGPLEEEAEKGFRATLEQLSAVAKEQNSARRLDAEGWLCYHRGDQEQAFKLWNRALDRNPNYHRAYANLVRLYRGQGKLDEAYALLQKMQEFNNANVSRMVDMGEIQIEMENEERAARHFQSALERDGHCGRALNGMAEVHFRRGELDESRRILANSNRPGNLATRLNRMGIDLVRREKFEEALELYTKAQYILPQQQKGPLLFYNIGLCYSRWGRGELASNYLKIALIKDPSYSKAEKLLGHIQQKARKAG